jgi:hypothetical protein
MPFIRHCLECGKCRTRYLIAFSPYANGSYLIRPVTSEVEEHLLYCSCAMPLTLSRCRGSELKTCIVSRAAYVRGYGTAVDVREIDQESKRMSSRSHSSP